MSLLELRNRVDALEAELAAVRGEINRKLHETAGRWTLTDRIRGALGEAEEDLTYEEVAEEVGHDNMGSVRSILYRLTMAGEARKTSAGWRAA